MKKKFEWLKPYVRVSDSKWVSTDLIKFVDIEEDDAGFDLITFEYEGKEYKSYIQNRP